MALLPIRIFGDPVLRERATEVTDFDERLARLAEDMLETMRAAKGVGLAANQVGVLKRLFTWEHFGESEDGIRARRLGEPGGRGDLRGDPGGRGGLPVLPGAVLPDERPLRGADRGQDVHGEEHEMEGEGTLARIFLHEIDHLNGILFIDHLARHDKKEAMRRIRAGELERNAAERHDGDGAARM
jgi:peptide deformylase